VAAKAERRRFLVLSKCQRGLLQDRRWNGVAIVGLLDRPGPLRYMRVAPVSVVWCHCGGEILVITIDTLSSPS